MANIIGEHLHEQEATIQPLQSIYFYAQFYHFVVEYRDMKLGIEYMKKGDIY